MTHISKTEIEQTRAAYIAGRDAIIKQLGKDAPMDEIIDVVLLLAHSLLTGGETLGLSFSEHNRQVFCDRLKELVELSQRNVKANDFCGRLM